MAKLTEIESNHPLLKLQRRWQMQHLLRLVVLSLLPAVALLFVLLLWLPLAMSGAFAVAAGLAVFAILFLQKPPKQITPARTAAWLNQQHPRLQHSAGLLLQQPQQLSLPARLQRQRIGQEVSTIAEKQQPPVNLMMPFTILCLLMLAGALMLRVWQPTAEAVNPFGASLPANVPDSVKRQVEQVKRALPQLQEARVRLAPPSYTRQAARFYELSDLQAPENSRITWQLSFNNAVNKVFLADQQNDTLHFEKTSRGAWTAQLQAQKQLFYRIGYATATDTAFSPFLKITVQPDEPPRLRILQPEQYLLEQEGQSFQVSVEAADDYGMEDLYLSLTISRGSGENVSFREEKRWIEIAAGAKEAATKLQLDPKALGMQPGDELYYRLEAHDNKPPRGQHRRSNSWYYQWKDTTQAVSMMSSGLAMDIEPEYFRSQRQIIIDTEKLISTQKSTPQQEWEKKNQNLAIDQKLLRLRYGKFLGEEFVSDAGGAPAGNAEEHPGDGHEEGHDDEEQTEEHDSAEYGNERHEHALAGHEEPAGASPAAGLVEMFGHAHDTEEGATFYEERIKVKLKAALAEMWEAEKYLRLSQPQQALPYEYRALKIIKEVQQSTRIYVERVGLDLPTLIPAEHRLKGEQEAIKPENRSLQKTAADTLGASRQLLSRLSFWEKGLSLSAAEQQLARQASREVARLLVIGGPYMDYFYLLNTLNSLQENSVPSVSDVRKAEQGLFLLLPKQSLPTARPQLLHHQHQQFLEAASTSVHD
ncbi:hypothetical protein [Cesiribacter sp. SM1]|uniref:hypothetical protein n=1 Tax=Cesiribacter sp. SM1 TaxID=2861196 RepID=UPI001CD22FDA|nr:hypothetical protein [Cesiribacter sp. SM1]